MPQTKPLHGVEPVARSDSDRQPDPLDCISECQWAVGEVTLNCAVGPNAGPPLILLHGVTRVWRDFEPVLPRLIEQWQVLAPEHRGHGKSSRASGDYRVQDYARDIRTLIERHVAGPVLIWGHSLGAMVAAWVAATLPDRITGLILEDPPGTTLASGIERSPFYLQFTGTRRLISQPGRSVEELTEALADLPVQHPATGAVVPLRELRPLPAIRFGARCLLQVDPAVLDPIVEGRWLEGMDWFGALPRITCPTLLLRADPTYGGMLAEPEASRIASLIPRCRRVDLPGVGHIIHSTEPVRTLDAVLPFLESLALSTTELRS